MNQTGGNHVGKNMVEQKVTMDTFDALPEPLRVIVRNASFDFDVRHVDRYRRQRGESAAVKFVPIYFAEASAAETLMVWGADHPALTKPKGKRRRGRPRKSGGVI